MHATKPAAASRAVHRKSLWIRQVCFDPKTRHLSCRIPALMLDYINHKEQAAWPSQQTLASAAGVTPRAVQAALKCLERSGHITIRRMPGRANRYQPRLLNGPSQAGAIPLNPGSETHEQGFVRLQETPLKKGEGDLERVRIGCEMSFLVKQLRGRSFRVSEEVAA